MDERTTSWIILGLIVLLSVMVIERLRWVERAGVLRWVRLWVTAAWTTWVTKLKPATGNPGISAVAPLEVDTQGHSGRTERTAKPLKPRSADDCAMCRAEGRGQAGQCRHREMERVYDRKTQRALIPWAARKSSQGRRKKGNTEGRACERVGCYYQGISDSRIHALVFNGVKATAQGEQVQQYKCQYCGAKFTARRNTAVYRLKTNVKEVKRVLHALAEGLSVSATSRVFEHRRQSIQTWADRGARHMSKLHDRVLRGLHVAHIQLDEIRTRLKGQTEAMWVWIAFEAKSKLRLATYIGARTQESAHALIHHMKGTLAEGCVPVFTSDGLKHYYYALTAHFGRWTKTDSADESQTHDRPTTASGKRKKKRGWTWIVDARLVYGQMIKKYVRRKLQEVRRVVLIGSLFDFVNRLRAVGLSGLIHTAFVERHNLLIRMSVSPLIRRSWSLVCSELALARRLELQRGFFHFSKPHGGLRIKLPQPLPREGRRIPKRYLQQTPMMAAGLTDRMLSFEEVLLHPLPEPDLLRLSPA